MFRWWIFFLATAKATSCFDHEGTEFQFNERAKAGETCPGAQGCDCTLRGGGGDTCFVVVDHPGADTNEYQVDKFYAFCGKKEQCVQPANPESSTGCYELTTLEDEDNPDSTRSPLTLDKYAETEFGSPSGTVNLESLTFQPGRTTVCCSAENLSNSPTLYETYQDQVRDFQTYGPVRSLGALTPFGLPFWEWSNPWPWLECETAAPSINGWHASWVFLSLGLILALLVVAVWYYGNGGTPTGHLHWEQYNDALQYKNQISKLELTELDKEWIYSVDNTFNREYPKLSKQTLHKYSNWALQKDYAKNRVTWMNNGLQDFAQQYIHENPCFRCCCVVPNHLYPLSRWSMLGLSISSLLVQLFLATLRCYISIWMFSGATDANFSRRSDMDPTGATFYFLMIPFAMVDTLFGRMWFGYHKSYGYYDDKQDESMCHNFLFDSQTCIMRFCYFGSCFCSREANMPIDSCYLPNPPDYAPALRKHRWIRKTLACQVVEKLFHLTWIVTVIVATYATLAQDGASSQICMYPLMGCFVFCIVFSWLILDPLFAGILFWCRYMRERDLSKAGRHHELGHVVKHDDHEKADTIWAWNYDHKHAVIRLMEEHRVACGGKDYDNATVVGSRKMLVNGGRNYKWRVSFLRGNNAHIGIVTEQGQDASVMEYDMPVGYNEHGWGYNSLYGEIRHKNERSRGGLPICAEGDYVDLTLDSEAGLLSLAVNGQDQGIVVADLKGKTVYPAATLHGATQIELTTLAEDYFHNNYIVSGKHGVVVRAKEDRGSKKLRRIKMGEVVSVEEVRGTRARITKPCNGWITWKLRDGRTLIDTVKEDMSQHTHRGEIPHYKVGDRIIDKEGITGHVRGVRRGFPVIYEVEWLNGKMVELHNEDIVSRQQEDNVQDPRTMIRARGVDIKAARNLDRNTRSHLRLGRLARLGESDKLREQQEYAQASYMSSAMSLGSFKSMNTEMMYSGQSTKSLSGGAPFGHLSSAASATLLLGDSNAASSLRSVRKTPLTSDASRRQASLARSMTEQSPHAAVSSAGSNASLTQILVDRQTEMWARERPSVGDKVVLTKHWRGKGPLKPGEVGILLEDSGDGQPFHIKTPNGETYWYFEPEVERSTKGKTFTDAEIEKLQTDAQIHNLDPDQMELLTRQETKNSRGYRAGDEVEYQGFSGVSIERVNDDGSYTLSVPGRGFVVAQLEELRGRHWRVRSAASAAELAERIGVTGGASSPHAAGGMEQTWSCGRCGYGSPDSAESCLQCGQLRKPRVWEEAAFDKLQPGHYVRWMGKYAGEMKYGYISRRDMSNRSYVYVRAEDSEKTFSKRMKVARLEFDSNHVPVPMATTVASSEHTASAGMANGIRAFSKMYGSVSNTSVHGM